MSEYYGAKTTLSIDTVYRKVSLANREKSENIDGAQLVIQLPVKSLRGQSLYECTVCRRIYRYGYPFKAYVITVL